MNRRQLLKLLALGVAGHTLDIDRLLWVPGSKTIFIPKPTLSLSEIVAAEWAAIAPKMHQLFERDDTFYTALLSMKPPHVIGGRDLRIPLIIKPGEMK